MSHFRLDYYLLLTDIGMVYIRITIRKNYPDRNLGWIYQDDREVPV